MFSWHNKRLLVLGATKLIAEIVNEAKRGGAFVAVADYFEDSPAKKLADESLLTDATDVKTLADYVRKNHIDGVLTGFTDSLLPAYMELCEVTGVPCYLNKDQLRFATDKAFFKECCREFSIPVIREYSPEDKLNFPLLLKPVDNSGARGIYICDKESDFASARANALKFSRSGNILIEDYLTCNEATAFYIFIDGTIYLAALADRHITAVKEGVIRLPSGYTYPSVGTDKFLEKTDPQLRKVFRKLNIRNGIMFLQGFLTSENDFIPYESGFRPTGSLEYKIFESVHGYNSLAMLINFALTGQMSDGKSCSRITPVFPEEAYNISCLMKPGKIAAIEGKEKLAALPGVQDCFYSYEIGDELTQENWGRLSQIFVRIQITGGRKNYNTVTDFLRKNFKVYDPTDQDLLITREICPSAAHNKGR